MNPRFSVLTTVYDPPPDALRACLASVRRQIWRDVEHVLVDDASPDPSVMATLRRSARRDDRTLVVHRATRGGIAVAAATALDAARGEWIVLLDHDDVLEPDALAAVAAALDVEPTADLLYTDHDLLRADGRYAEPFYKPDFDVERLRSHNYVTHLVVARRSLVQEVGGFREGFDGAQDHDLLLRLAERARNVVHLPRVLHHWRQAAASVATDAASKPYAYDSGRRAVQEHCDRMGIDAEVTEGSELGCYRVRRRVRDTTTVNVVVVASGARESVWGRPRLHAAELLAGLRAMEQGFVVEPVIVLRDDVSATVEQAIRRAAGDVARTVRVEPGAPVEHAVDAGVAAGSGEVVVVLDERCAPVDADALHVLVAHAIDPEVGLSGGILLGSDGRVLHAGFVLHGGVADAGCGWPGEHPGPGRALAVERGCAAVSLRAAAMRREVHDRVGGCAATVTPHAPGVGLSLALRRHGLRVVFTPFSRWHCFAAPPASDGVVDDAALTDPYANPNLVPGRGDWLELPGRAGAPPYVVDAAGVRHWG